MFKSRNVTRSTVGNVQRNACCMLCVITKPSFLSHNAQCVRVQTDGTNFTILF